MSAPLIDVDDLIEFIDELRLAGYDISTQQYIGAQNLLLALAANGQLPSDPRALQTWLAPVLCSSPREQNNFYRRFDRWIAQHPRFAEAKAAKKELDIEQSIIEEAERRDWRHTLLQAKYLVPLLALLLIIAGVVFLPPLIPRTLTGQVVDDDNKQPLTNAKISLGDKTTVSDNSGAFSISYRSKQLPDRLIAEYPEYETATLTVDANSQSPLVVKLQQPAPTPDPSPTTDPTPYPAVTVTPNVIPIPTPSVVPVTVTGNRMKWVRYGGAILPLFLFGVWLLWEKKLSKALLKKLRSANQPHLDQIVVKGVAGQLFLGQSFRRTIQELRRHRLRGARELDAPGTVHRTIQRGGLFSPFYGLRQTLPEYLVLIDRASFQDQQARLEEELIRRLVQENVFVDSYYFHGDPRLCRAAGKDARFVTLQEMAALHPDHHLIIFSDGSTFLNPMTGAPEPWLEMFSPWAKRALLTSEPASQWGYREWALAELDFIVLPATKEGLAALTELIDGGASPLLDRSQRARPFPPMLRERPRRWLDNHEPAPEIANQLCDQLKLFLGSKGYFWLSACAIYPILYWDLTLYLGFKLFTDRAEIEERLLSLVRLPWFRYGTLPDWLRSKLSSELSEEDNLRIRRILEDLFLTLLQEPSEGIRLEIATAGGESRLKQWLKSWKFKRFLRQSLKEEPPESPLHDYVFLAFMSGRKPRKLTVSVPDSIRRVFFPQGQFALGMRPLSALVLAALLSVAMFSLVPTQAGSTGPDDPTPTPTPVRLYAQMSEDEKNGFVRQKAEAILSELGPGYFDLSDEGLGSIKSYVDAYAGRVGSTSTSLWSENLSTVLARGSHYAPAIIQAFTENQVPQIVGLYIAMTYSEFTDQRAPTGASGLFQLSSASAADFGITAAERSDVTKSAQAAARFVVSSRNTLGSDSASMTLVILSYSRGVTKVTQDLQRLGNPYSPSFWVLQGNAERLDQQFRNEDAKYVPRFFAAAIIGENPEIFGIEMAPLSAYWAVSPSLDQQLADLIAKFNGDERRNASDQIVQLYGQNKTAVVKALIDAIQDQGPASYRVNLYIARTLGSVQPYWEGTKEQLIRLETLKGSRDYFDATFKAWVDKAIGNFYESQAATATPTPQALPTPAGSPVFYFTVSPTRARVGQPVTFALSVDPPDTAVSFGLNFGDGSPMVPVPWPRTHSYSRPGVYKVVATATSPNFATPLVQSATVVVTQDVTVPNLIGMSSDAARKAAAGNSLSIGRVTYQETSRQPAGSVISQSPRSGAVVSSGTAINIIVAKEEAAPADQSLVTVPNVVGKDSDTAEKMLEAAGLKRGFTRSIGTTVLSQDPEPGSKVPRGTVVTLTMKRKQPGVIIN